MKCPICGVNNEQSVSRTDGAPDDAVLRTRNCDVCGNSWSTTETIDKPERFYKRAYEFLRDKSTV